MNSSELDLSQHSLTIRPYDNSIDSVFLHNWVNRDYAIFWGLQGATLDKVREEYHSLLRRKNYSVFVGEISSHPVFILERYDPNFDEIKELYDYKSGDLGLHLIVAPPGAKSIKNFTTILLNSILDFLFSHSDVNRIIVEPDIRNKKMITLCERLGFQADRIIELSNKTARLLYIEKETFIKTRIAKTLENRCYMNSVDNAVSPKQSVIHLEKDRWQRANQHLIRKAICEFSHERLLEPKLIGSKQDSWNEYMVSANDAVAYTFLAKNLPLDHLLIDKDSIKKTTGEDLDIIAFIKEFRAQLKISDEQLPNYLEEIMSTLNGSVFKMQKGNPNATYLAREADFQTIEQSMTEGHPCFVANNGRIGFDAGDYRAFAPEVGNTFAMMWLAGHKKKAVYAATDDLPYEKLIAQELDDETIKTFHDVIESQGSDPSDYIFIPIHPWQWFNKLATVFASEIASGDLICLGYSPDEYLAQQSVRTMYNVSNPQKFYTKSALSILNMGFMRGLPLYYLGTAPVMANWLAEVLYKDPYIKKSGFRMLGEIASASYVNPYFEEFGPHNDYNKMLASLWRESPMSVAKDHQRVMTMAALLHIDDNDQSFLVELIAASGLSTTEWLQSYFAAYLGPLLHCFYEYDLVFMPHGENIILVLEDEIPIKMLLKDITEEAAVLSKEVELPENLRRMFVEVPEDVKLLSIFIDIFDDFFRFMAEILESKADFSAHKFWAEVAIFIKSYQDDHPHLKEKFKTYDLFTERFKLSCLNRLQIQNHRQMIDLDEPVEKLQMQGMISNPIAMYRN
ncbi:MAG: GNAT family N-acetyltransferase [Pseudobacteriovorax sp.]|nr:GNAT family N-acetyltransferase [Pseudobacteriovorax sp.]